MRTSREVCDRTLLRVVLTELGTNPTDIGIKCSSHIRCQPRSNTFHHHPEKLLHDGDDDEW